MDTSLWTELSKKIQERRGMAVELIQEMVRRPSFESELEIQQYLETWLKERKIPVDVWEPDIRELKQHRGVVDVEYDYQGRPNLVAWLKGRGGGRSLTLNGHMDTVPVEPGEQWTYGDPWSGALVDGKIYGRGAVDMKGGIAVALLVLDSLLECGIQLKGDLQLQCVVDEETGGNGTLAAITRGYRSDATIFLEPTSSKSLVVSSRGAQFFRIIVPGKGGGIEYQFTYPNAIEKACKLYQAVRAYALLRASQADHPLYAHDPTKIPTDVCTIHAGNWPSTLPGQCVMEGSLECLPGEDIEQVKAEFRAYLLEAARQDPWMKENPPQIEWFGLHFEAGETDLGSPLITGLQDACEQVTGEKPAVLGGGGSDLRLPVLYAGSPSVLFGPSGGAIHSLDEYVEIDSVLEMARIIGRFVLDWCGVANY